MDALSDMKFGVGQPVSRKEDPVLLRGQGRYTDDINLPGQAYAVMVRSKIAHGLLKGIDAAAAAAMPGVLTILTNDDLTAAGFGPLRCEVNFPDRDGKPMKTPPRPSLAKGKVRYVGEAVACVLRVTPARGKTGAEVDPGIVAGDLILIRVVGSHFLWKMVRQIVGALAEVGRGSLTPAEVGRFLATVRAA